MNKMTFLFTTLAAGFLLNAEPSQASPTFLGPTEYKGFADSPFNGGVFSYFYLENFESGSIQTPGVATNPGTFIYTGADNVDSVDEDDGAIDGEGVLGSSFYSAGLNAIEFTFDDTVLGNFPSHVGIVWTDVGFSSPIHGFGDVSFSAYDSSDHLIGTFGPYFVGDGSSNSSVLDDRFFGLIYASGISRFVIDMEHSGDWEVDHLQYGYTQLVRDTDVPEPATLLLLTLGTAALVCLRQKKKASIF